MLQVVKISVPSHIYHRRSYRRKYCSFDLSQSRANNNLKGFHPACARFEKMSEYAKGPKFRGYVAVP
jgi:hypothetical protein